jgi:hypothetical protein
MNVSDEGPWIIVTGYDKMLEEGVGFCHKCNRETHWHFSRGGKRLKCDDCKDIFPCYYDCEHVDCQAVKGD